MRTRNLMSFALLHLLFTLIILSCESSATGSKHNPEEGMHPPTEAQAMEDLEKQEEAPNWEYIEEEDEMTGDKMIAAATVSTNELEFEFPYDGGSYFQLIIRKIKEEQSVILQITKGQFMSNFNGDNTLRVKFDDGEVTNYNYSSSANGNSDVIFLNSSEKFTKQLLKANKVMIEAPFYEVGRKVGYFDVAGLEWEI